MKICAVDREMLERAIMLNMPDFEDAVQVACAMLLGLDGITTRDMKGSEGALIQILAPGDLKSRLMQQ